MKIWHRVSFNGRDTKFKNSLDELGIEYKISPLPHQELGLISFDIDETNPHWSQIEVLIQEFEALDVYDSIFDEEEILSAQWNRLIPVFEKGYPQPESDWSVDPATFGGQCSDCGKYKEKQLESFRIKNEPRLGRNDFMSLYWTYALFTTASVLDEFTKNHLRGYEVWDVLIHKTGQPSEIISQVYMPNETAATLIPEENLKKHTCLQCGMTKYFPHMRGCMQFSPDILESEVDFMLSREWFGDGHAAYQEILVSQKVTRLIVGNKWRGVRLKPVLSSS